MQFIKGIDEPCVPDIKLTRSKDGSNGVGVPDYCAMCISSLHQAPPQAACHACTTLIYGLSMNTKSCGTMQHALSTTISHAESILTRSVVQRCSSSMDRLSSRRATS